MHDLRNVRTLNVHLYTSVCSLELGILKLDNLLYRVEFHVTQRTIGKQQRLHWNHKLLERWDGHLFFKNINRVNDLLLRLTVLIQVDYLFVVIINFELLHGFWHFYSSELILICLHFQHLLMYLIKILFVLYLQLLLISRLLMYQLQLSILLIDLRRCQLLNFMQNSLVQPRILDLRFIEVDNVCFIGALSVVHIAEQNLPNAAVLVE